MLPCQNRLAAQKDFETVHRSGKFFSLGSISLKVGKNNLEKTRIGIAVGLKFSKKAVERNRIKRQIRAIVKSYLPNKMKKGFDVVIMPKKSQTAVSFQDLSENLENIFKKANLIHPVK